MTTVQAGLTYYKQLNEQIRAAQDSEITVENVIGQRYIGCGSTDRKITVYGTAGNGLGHYLNGSTIEAVSYTHLATAAAMLVVTNTRDATSAPPPDRATVEQPLKPNQPNHRMKQPRAPSVRE